MQGNMEFDAPGNTVEHQQYLREGFKGAPRTTNMIFSHVLATIAVDLLEHLPGDREGFLRSLVPSDVGVHHSNETGNLCLYGRLDKIVECQEKLAEFLQLEGYADCVDSILGLKRRKICVDVATDCDLLSESLENGSSIDAKIETKAAVEHETSQSDGEDIEASDEFDKNKNIEAHNSIKSDTEDGVYGQSETKKKEIVTTKRGRHVKRTFKVANIYKEFHSLDDELAENDPVIPEKRHRRYFRSKRRQVVTRFKAKEKISVEDVRRLVQEEKLKEEREKGNSEVGTSGQPQAGQLDASVLQSIFMNSLSELQVQEAQKKTIELYSDSKDSDNRKAMKQFYEDRMPYKYFCDKCSFKTKRESHYGAHKELHLKNPDMKLFRCEMCDFVSIRQSVLNKHQVMHKDKNQVLKCSLCSYQTSTQRAMDLHCKKHSRNQKLDEIPKLKCHMCKFTTLSKAKFVAHTEDHGQQEGGEMWYNCDLCNYKTKRKEHLVRHQHNVHSNNRPFLCDLCGAAFKRVDTLAAHKITHIEKSKRVLPFICPHCKKPFKSQAHLKEHSAVHTTVRSFQCHICGQMFKTRSVQRRHQQNVHFNPRSHKCTRCNKEFNTKYSFQRHLRMHDSDPTDHPPTLIQPKPLEEGKTGENTVDTEDENVSAIQTITIAPDNITDLTQQLQNITDQMQSGSDTGEIYIQGLEGMEMETINIVNVPGQEVRQIYLPNDADPSTVLTSSDQVKHIYITSKSDENSEQMAGKKLDTISQADFVKQILMASDGGSLNLSGFKELFVQSEDGNETVRHILIPTMESTGTGEFGDQVEMTGDIEGVGNQTLLVQNEETGEGSSGETVKASVGGQTYQITVENGQALMTVAGSNSVHNL